MASITKAEGETTDDPVDKAVAALEMGTNDKDIREMLKQEFNLR